MNYKRNQDLIEIEIPKEHDGLTLQQWFEKYHLGKKTIHELRMSKRVSINQETIFQNFHTVLKTNDMLSFPFFVEEEIDFIPQEMVLEIVYEDEFMLIVNKPIHMEVHPDTKAGLNTLVNGVAYYYQQTGQQQRVRYIHRLDTDTSGGIVFVKNLFVHNLYDYLLSVKAIKRYYLAIVSHKPPKKTDTINRPIGKDRHHNQKRILSDTGDEAITHYKVLQEKEDYSVLECILETGRTHQIRVHLASIGCPILGDELYGVPDDKIDRQALHAYKLQLLHPITLKPFIVNIPLPRDLQAFLNDK